MRDPWTGVIWRTAGMLAVAGIVGLVLGQVMAVLLAAALGCLLWHLHRLYRFERWLSRPARGRPFESEGVWGDVYHHLRRARRRQRQRERRLLHLLRQFQQATAAVPDAAVVLDQADQVIWCNEAAIRLLGLRIPQDLSQRITHLVRHPAFVGLLAGRYRHRSQEFPSPVDNAVILSVRLVPYGEGQRLLLASDITRVRRLEQIRQDFVSNVSHELRTPLTVIRGYLEALLDSEDDCAERWDRPLRGMQRQTNRMLHIVEDLLMLSRLETEATRRAHRPVNVPELIRTIVDDAQVLVEERGHRVETVIDPGLGVLGTEQELRSAFSNLLINAVRYTPDGGHITLRWYADEGGIHFEVEDDGEGIALQHIPRLTERFYRVDRGRSREAGGTGLGLAIVKHVVNRHDGRFRIHSQVGLGSTFVCVFPLKGRVTVDGHPDTLA